MDLTWRDEGKGVRVRGDVPDDDSDDRVIEVAGLFAHLISAASLFGLDPAHVVANVAGYCVERWGGYRGAKVEECLRALIRAGKDLDKAIEASMKGGCDV